MTPSQAPSHRRKLLVGVAATALWAGAFRFGVTTGLAVEALSLLAVLAVIVVVKVAPDVRDALRPDVRSVLVGLAFGAVTVFATVTLYPHLRDVLATQLGLDIDHEVRRFYDIIPFTAALVPLIVLVAAAEELLWRGLFFSAFDGKPVLAVGVSALAYGLGQLGGAPVLAGAALFFGVLWGIEAKLTKGLVAPMISHLMWTTSVFGVWPLVGGR